MIVSRTPFRVSLFGGGSDYPAWYLKNGGRVFGFAINKYCYITLRPLPPFFEHKHRVVYSRVELANDINDIEHPAVRAVCLEHPDPEGRGLELHHDGDLPARSGLGSSSSFTVGLLNAMTALRGEMVKKRYLAEEAIRIEQDVIGEAVGSQDQIWAAYGGMNVIDFNQDGSFDVRPMIIRKQRSREMMDHLLLYFTGFSRFAVKIAEKKIANLAAKERQIVTMTEMVDEALSIVGNENTPITELGDLLHQSWMLKRELADTVSTPEVDEIYEAGRDAGAIGGKLLGAGGGGFILFFVEPSKRQAVKERLDKLIRVGIDVDTVGSKIVLYEPSGLENQ